MFMLALSADLLKGLQRVLLIFTKIFRFIFRLAQRVVRFRTSLLSSLLWFLLLKKNNMDFRWLWLRSTMLTCVLLLVDNWLLRCFTSTRHRRYSALTIPEQVLIAPHCCIMAHSLIYQDCIRFYFPQT